MFSASAIGCLGGGNTSLTSGGSISRPATKKKALNPANVKTTASVNAAATAIRTDFIYSFYSLHLHRHFFALAVVMTGDCTMFTTTAPLQTISYLPPRFA